MKVRVGVEHPFEPWQILGESADVRADECHVEAARDEGLEGVGQGVERWEPRSIAEPPVRVLEEFLQALVVLVERLEEREGIAGVDHHRDAGVGACIPDGIEPRVVGQDQLAARGRAGAGRGPSRP